MNKLRKNVIINIGTAQTLYGPQQMIKCLTLTLRFYRTNWKKKMKRELGIGYSDLIT